MTTYNADVEANAMYTALIAGSDITLPTIDLSDPAFAIPSDTDSALYQSITPMTNEDLTTRRVGGDGTFDAVMAGMAAQLKNEFEKGRITGAEYTKAFIALADSALQNSVQFLIQKNQAYWQSQTAQAQAITARIQAKTALMALVQAQYDALTAKAQFTAAKASLANTSVQYGQSTYQVNYTLPAQLSVIKEQMEQARAQTLGTRSDGTTTAGVLGKQVALYTQQITSYQRDAEVKAAKLFTDAWITQKTVDDGLDPPQGFTNDSVNEVLTVLMANNGFGSPEA